MRQFQLKQYARVVIVLFCLLFIFTFPFPFYYLPSPGIILQPFLEDLTCWMTNSIDGTFYSDSPLMWSFSVILILVSLLIGAGLSFITKEKLSLFWDISYHILLYYLILILFYYGLSKIFIYQFYWPEPNTLFTPVGQLSKDFLFWTSMGTSPVYSVFSGCLEIIPALLLVFPRTRMFGASVSIFVLINVLMINLGFGITVVQFTLFLLLINFLILTPYLPLIQRYIWSKPTTISVQNIEFFILKKHPNYRKIFRVLILLAIVIESLSIYVDYGAWNGNNLPRSNEYGAYSFKEDDAPYKRLFFHKNTYLILQAKNDEFFNYPYVKSGEKYTIYKNDQTIGEFTFVSNKPYKYTLKGYFYDNPVLWQLEKIKLELLPIYKN